MRRLPLIAAMFTLILAVTACTSVVAGQAMAPEGVSATGVRISDDGYGVVLGNAESVAIDVFIEPQCPHCGHFFDEFGDELSKHVSKDDLAVTIRPVTFLDFEDDYSARASNAIFLAAQQPGVTPKDVFGYVMALYADLASGVLPGDDDVLAEVAAESGLDADTVELIASGEQAVDATAMSDSNIEMMEQWGDAATPTVHDSVRDEIVDTGDPEWISKLLASN
jgi:protein-disulfide isomerase